MRVNTFAALIAVSLLAVPAAAQEQRGSILGVVTDASGAVLPGVTVEARSPSVVGVSTSVTDDQGNYRFPALPPGTYQVSANLTGFVAASVTDAVVTLGKQLTINLTMKLAGLTESVTVTAESPIIDVKANAVTASVDSTLIALIPKGRGLLSVLTQIPGTNNENRGGGLMIDGASGSENRFVVDGVDRTNARTGTATAITATNGSGGTEIVMQDFIEEVQVKQSGWNAEYRAALGGVVNAVTKTGSNAFHGSAATYYTDNKWLGDIRRTLRSVPTNAALAEYIQTPRDESHQTDVALTLGGPVLRNKAWFFVGYAPQFYPSERTVTWVTPGTFPATQTFDNGSPNNKALNYNVTSQLANPLRARFTGNNETQKGALGLPGIEPNGTSTTSAATYNPRSSVFTEQFSNAYSGIVDWVATEKTYVNVTASYLGYGLHSAGGDYYHGTRRTFSTTNVGMSGVPANFQNVNGFADNNSNSFTVADDYQRFDLNMDVTRYARWKGEHAFKIGAMYERIGNFADLGQQHVNIAFNWNSTLVTTQNVPVTGTYGYFVASRQYTDGDINETNLSFFAQDAWSVNRKLTVNYGLRLEKEEIPSYNPNAPGVNFGWGDKIAPRAGFAYDVKGDGRWKAYGSYGLFFDTMKLDMPRGAWGGEKWISYYYTLDTFDWPSIDCQGPNGEGGCNGGRFIEAINFRHTSNEPGSEIGEIDPNLQPTQKHEYTLGLDRELPARMALGVRYVHKGWDQTIDDIGVCAPGSQTCGEVYNIGNPGYGVGKNPIEGPYPSVPKVNNVYDGLELVLRKRYSNNWQATSSVVFSRLYGNYGGLASSDENGRTAPNVSRYYDSLFLSFDQKGNEAIGRLNTDRPVQFKLQGSYTMPWRTSLGLNFVAMSGLIQSSTVSYQGVPIYFNGRGDLGRTPVFSQTDLLIAHDFRIGGSKTIGLQANVMNLFDQETVTRLAFSAYRDALVIPGFPSRPADAFFQPGGFDTVAIQAARLPASGRPSPTYNQADQFQGARSIRVMARVGF
jgi:outer membrane receptor protein involved in Fe transport